MSTAAPRLATAVDLISLGDASAEVVGGAIVYKADASAEHGDAQASLATLLRQDFHRRGGGDHPGGWWIVDPERRILTVYRLEDKTYSVALQAKQGESVQAPPFELMSLRVGLLFGEDPD